jgi:glutamate synthase (ferredoxin)
MVRSCHLDTCPVGIASQRPELRAKFAGTPEMVEAYLRFVALEVREHLSRLGLATLDEAVGRVDLLRQRRTGDASADALDLGALLVGRGQGHARYVGQAVPHEGDRLVEAAYQVTNADRAIGARLGGAIAKAVGSAAPAGRVRARFEGAAGQSFGAFVTQGVELRLVGEANDYVGKSMSGGRIVVAPPANDAGDPCLLGNTVLYGATGGELFCAGSAGERFAVRNSGAVAVVEGVGDHACEYMTRGTVVVLGSHGRNLGAGMTGGEAFLLDPDERLVNGELVDLVALERHDAERLVELLERHARLTGSQRATALLADRDTALGRFRRLAPRTELEERDVVDEGRLTA